MAFPDITPLPIYPAETQVFYHGVNRAKNAEHIDFTEAWQLHNCEFDENDNSPRTVDGVRIVYDAGIPVERLFYDHVNDVRFFSSSTNIYSSDLLSKTLLGALTGTDKPVFDMFGTACLVSSGGQLQRITGGNTLQTLSNSPLCHFVEVRKGRVVVFNKSSDVRNYSAIGDENGWTNNPSDASTAQYADVGYKDPGNIIATANIANMSLVFKQYGRVYQILNEPTESDFSVLPFSETASCISINSALSVDNKAFYHGHSGFMNFVPTTAYGNITPQEAGYNLNSVLIPNTDSSAQIWHVQPKKQIWIRSQNDTMVYIYHYSPRYPYDEATGSRGAWTTRSFKYPLNDVSVVGTQIYIAYGNKIGVLDSSIDTDDGDQIQTSIIGKNQLPIKRHLMVRSKSLVTQNRISGYGTLTLGKKPPKQISFGSGDTEIYFDERYIDDADEDIFSEDITPYYKPGGGGGNDNLQYSLLIQKGAVSIRRMDYTYSEV